MDEYGGNTHLMLNEEMIIALRFAIREEMQGVIRASEQRVGEKIDTLVAQLVGLQQLLEKVQDHKPSVHAGNVTVIAMKEAMQVFIEGAEGKE
jgi:hypothetical protein